MPSRRIDRVYRVVEALMILHNILMELGDTPDVIEDYDPTDLQASAL